LFYKLGCNVLLVLCRLPVRLFWSGWELQGRGSEIVFAPRRGSVIISFASGWLLSTEPVARLWFTLAPLDFLCFLPAVLSELLLAGLSGGHVAGFGFGLEIRACFGARKMGRKPGGQRVRLYCGASPFDAPVSRPFSGPGIGATGAS